MTNNHPSLIAATKVTNLIKQHAADAELAGELTPQQIQLIYDHNWFNLYIPSELGGLETPLPVAIRLLEILARADASFGWTVTLCSGANWFAGFLDKTLCASLWSNKQVCIAGSGAATGKASITKNGYIVKGDWKYATGAPHATVFSANCIIEKDGEPLLTEDNTPVLKAFIFTRDEVEIRHNWNTIGMKATASHSFSVKALELPFSRSFIIHPDQAVLPDLIFQIPFQSFAEITLAANFSGIAAHFIEECKRLYEDRIKRHAYAITETCEMLDLLGRTCSKLEGTQLRFYHALDKAWQNANHDKQWNPKDIETLKQVCRNIVQQARHSVDELFPYCGMTAANEDSEINRVWRDFHTASLHGIFTFGYR